MRISTNEKLVMIRHSPFNYSIFSFNRNSGKTLQLFTILQRFAGKIAADHITIFNDVASVA